MSKKKEKGEDPDLKELEDLVQDSFGDPISRPSISTPKIDKDFEPKDPGWPYPDQDWAFEVRTRR